MSALAKVVRALKTLHRERLVEGAQAPWRWREREWVWWATAVCAACLLFSVWPTLDLSLSRFMRDAEGGFVGFRFAPVRAFNNAVPWLGRGFVLLGLLVAVVHWFGPWRLGARWRRRCMVLGLAMLLGTGVVVNLALKEHWGRARPVGLQEFGGTERYTPALRPSNQCRTNCSFVSGHAATGFTLLALGMFGAPSTRRRWLAIGVLAGLTIGAVRMAQGGHFLSDVVFSGLVVWGTVAVQREVWLRWVARRRRLARGMDWA